MMKMAAPIGCPSCSFEGIEYLVKNGEVTVPDRAAAQLMCHGFTPMEACTDPDASAKIAHAQQLADADARINQATIELDRAQVDANTAKAAGDVLRMNSALAAVAAAQMKLSQARDARVMSTPYQPLVQPAAAA